MIHTVASPALWAGFLALIVLFLALDLGVFHRKDQPVSIRDALGWTAVWIAAALGFACFLWWRFGAAPAAEFVTGWLIEKSLSVDNLFVFVVIFSTLRIPAQYQHRVLYWGIVTALVLRAAMILAGTALLERFHWLLYVFGAFLVITGAKLFLHRTGDAAPHPEQGVLFRLVRRLIPSTSRIEGHHFLLREGGRLVATPLLVALVLVELSDVVFALDSIPAIFGVTLDPFVVFTSNIFAILGLRSLFFALAGLMDRFVHLKSGLALVLLFIGGKMVASPWIQVSQGASLAVVAALLGGAVAFSLRAAQAEPLPLSPTGGEGRGEGAAADSSASPCGEDRPYVSED
ncbi:MAG TPA: TerC family protein [Anaeromyxobacteraceae bacterium]|nr:TerC family protein [Anaeromyxobacteraceae bacterium]